MAGGGEGGTGDVAQREFACDRLEVWLLRTPDALHLGSPQIVGDEHEHQSGGLDLWHQLLGAQHGLVEPVAAHAGIDRAATDQWLQQRRPGLAVAHLVAMGVGIAHRQYGRFGQHRAGRRGRETVTVGIVGDALGAEARPQHEAQLAVALQPSGAGAQRRLSFLEDDVRPVEQRGRSAPQPAAQFEQEQPDQQRAEDQRRAAQHLSCP